MLSYLFEYHLKSQSPILSAGTVAHYNTTVRYLQEFLKKEKKVDDIVLKDIDYQFVTDFKAFLHTRILPTDHQRPMSHNVVMKHFLIFHFCQ